MTSSTNELIALISSSTTNDKAFHLILLKFIQNFLDTHC